jgi:hypothetical protein
VSFGVYVCVNKRGHTVSLLVDEHATASLMYAVCLLCADYEAHKQELLEAAPVLLIHMVPRTAWGTTPKPPRFADRLRVIEGVYRDVVDKELWGL